MMPRKCRYQVLVPDRVHHVYMRGNNRRTLFSSSVERRRYLMILEEGLSKYPCLLHHIALLTNHIHYALTPPNLETLSKLMKFVGQKYAVYRNRRRGGTGKLFEQRYECRVIANDNHMRVIGGYIDLNPELSGMPKRYLAWSTKNIHLGEPSLTIPECLWTPSPWYLALATTAKGRQASYAKWLSEYRARRQGWDKEFDVFGTQVRGDKCFKGVLRPDGTSAR
ncbi:MAG: transposase [Myxococcales bacterium]|nr:MAG: transposase [Myxococcales bacterium]